MRCVLCCSNSKVGDPCHADGYAKIWGAVESFVFLFFFVFRSKVVVSSRVVVVVMRALSLLVVRRNEQKQCPLIGTNGAHSKNNENGKWQNVVPKMPLGAGWEIRMHNSKMKNTTTTPRHSKKGVKKIRSGRNKKKRPIIVPIVQQKVRFFSCAHLV